jgi:hypothetical protein
MVGKILGIDWTKTSVPDYEVIAKLEKIVQTNREFAQVSRKLSDSVRCCPGQVETPRDSARTAATFPIGEMEENMDDFEPHKFGRRNM